MLVRLHPIAASFEHITDGCIGRQTQGLVAKPVANVVGTVGGRRLGAAIAVERRKPYTKARRAGDGPNDTGEGDRAVHPA